MPTIAGQGQGLALSQKIDFLKSKLDKAKKGDGLEKSTPQDAQDGNGHYSDLEKSTAVVQMAWKSHLQALLAWKSPMLMTMSLMTTSKPSGPWC